MSDIRNGVLVTVVFVFILTVTPGIHAQEDGGIRVLERDGKRGQRTQQRTEDGPQNLNRVLAIVGQKVLTMNDYRRSEGDTQVTKKKLKPLVNRLLLIEAAREQKIMPSEARLQNLVEQRINQLTSQTRGGFQRLLAERGISESEYRESLRRKVLKQVLENRVLVRTFPELRESDTTQAQIVSKARIIVTSNIADAWQIYGWLNANPSQSAWNTLFERYSDRLGLMGTHGDLGWFRWGRFNEKIEFRVFKLDQYRVSRPFKLRDRYALVYPTEFRINQNADISRATRKAYRKYRRRYYRDRLYDRLRRDYSVVIPDSVKKKFEDNGF